MSNDTWTIIACIIGGPVVAILGFTCLFIRLRAFHDGLNSKQEDK